MQWVKVSLLPPHPNLFGITSPRSNLSNQRNLLPDALNSSSHYTPMLSAGSDAPAWLDTVSRSLPNGAKIMEGSVTADGAAISWGLEDDFRSILV